MCRLLFVRSKEELDTNYYLKKLAKIAKNSKEYQGHGWGCAYLKNDEWIFYRNIKPIWEDNLDQFPKTNLLLAHARSAFKDEGIIVENNMPFYGKDFVFVFNGELQGVKINEKGRIGAEKIFNYVLRFYKGDMLEAINRAVSIIKKRTKYIRAMNFIVASTQKAYLCSFFNEDPEYFTMKFKKENNSLIVSSELYDEEKWKNIENNTIKELVCS